MKLLSHICPLLFYWGGLHSILLSWFSLESKFPSRNKFSHNFSLGLYSKHNQSLEIKLEGGTLLFFLFCDFSLMKNDPGETWPSEDSEYCNSGNISDSQTNIPAAVAGFPHNIYYHHRLPTSSQHNARLRATTNKQKHLQSVATEDISCYN